MEKIKRISLIAIIFIGFALGFLTLKNLLGIVPQHQIKASNFQLFNYDGFEDYSIENCDSGYFYAYNEVPNSVRQKKPTDVVLIEKPENAVKIGVSILISKFGEKYIMQQKPFIVVLVNNKVWKVSGNPDVLEKPSAIYIQAADGQILGIYSNK